MGERDRINWRYRAITDRALWMADGKCAGTNGRWHVTPTWGDETREQRTAREQVAKQMCSECQVQDRCREYAIEHGEMDVWGATTRSERIRMVRVRRSQGSSPA